MIDEKEKRRKARIEAIYKKARKQKELSKYGARSVYKYKRSNVNGANEHSHS